MSVGLLLQLVFTGFAVLLPAASTTSLLITQAKVTRYSLQEQEIQVLRQNKIHQNTSVNENYRTEGAYMNLMEFWRRKV